MSLEKLLELREIIKSAPEDSDLYIETVNKITGGVGCVNFTNDGKVKVYEGADDGSDDKVISYDEFLQNYEFQLYDRSC